MVRPPDITMAACRMGERRSARSPSRCIEQCQVPGLVEAGFSRFDGVPSEVLSCVQSFVLDGRDQSELAV
jgi:hypothetical protein